MDSLDLSMQGLSPALRPGWWLPFDAVKADVLKRSRSLCSLMDKRTESRHLLDEAALETGLSIEELMYLPLTSSKRMDWIALISPAGDVVGYAPVDGFE
jgi:hypothetical protein